VTRRRLRPAHPQEHLAELYSKPHDHRVQAEGDDHELRVAATLALIREVGHVRRAADLSCGNGVLLDAVDADEKFYGDLALGYEITGPIEETIGLLPHVDLFLCCETLEHLDDPDAVLRSIRGKSDRLILSTPLDERGTTNVEHYWGWDARGIRTMLDRAGWHAERHRITVPKKGYRFQLWGCR